MSEEGYSHLSATTHEQFNNSPFEIECIETVEELDKPFTQYSGITIEDDRANGHNYHYSNLSEK